MPVRLVRLDVLDDPVRVTRVLGRRLELTALRRDGLELPVELAITKIPGTDPARFRAYLRDISERKQAEAMLARRARQMALRADVSLALAGRGTSVSAMLQRCAEAVVNHLEVAFARVWT